MQKRFRRSMGIEDLKMSDWLKNILAEDLKDPELVKALVENQNRIVSIMSPHVNRCLKKNKYNLQDTSEDLVRILRKHKNYK